MRATFVFAGHPLQLFNLLLSLVSEHGVPGSGLEVDGLPLVWVGAFAENIEVASAISAACALVKFGNGASEKFWIVALGPDFDHSRDESDGVSEPAVGFELASVDDRFLRVVLGFEDGDSSDDCADDGLAESSGSVAIAGELAVEVPLLIPLAAETARRFLVFDEELSTFCILTQHVETPAIENWLSGLRMRNRQRKDKIKLNSVISTVSPGPDIITFEIEPLEIVYEGTRNSLRTLCALWRALIISIIE